MSPRKGIRAAALLALTITGVALHGQTVSEQVAVALRDHMSGTCAEAVNASTIRAPEVILPEGEQLRVLSANVRRDSNVLEARIACVRRKCLPFWISAPVSPVLAAHVMREAVKGNRNGPFIVRRGERVQLVMESTSSRLTLPATAMENARAGEKLRIRAAGKVMTANAMRAGVVRATNEDER